MKAKISALMDGEVQDTEFEGMMRALREDPDALETWRRYHLISDALRDTQLLSSGFSDRVAARLADEPTVLAPARPAPRAEPHRWRALSMAASFAAVALVGWLAFAPQSGIDSGSGQIAQAPSAAAVAENVAVPLPRAANDYLLAHQNYSPRYSMQPVAPYVRTVAETTRPR